MAPLRKRLKVSHDAEAESVDSKAESVSGNGGGSDIYHSTIADDSSDGEQQGDSKAVDDNITDSSDGSDSDQVVGLDESKSGDARISVKARSRPPMRSVGISQASDYEGQVEALLQQMRPKHAQIEMEAEEALHKLRKTIEAVPPLGPFQLRDAVKVLKEQKVAIPFPEPRPEHESSLKYAYAPPATINVVGSYPNKTASRSRRFLHVDMVVQMPDALFQEKDFINHRYFHRRAFYLACLASAIKAAHGTAFELRYQHHHDDRLKPVLTIRTLTKLDADGNATPARKWQINILPSIGTAVFPASKLALNKLSLRQQVNSLQDGRLAARNMAYNSSLRSDMLVSSYLKLLHQASTSCSAYRDACALGTTWLRSRGFRATPRRGGFGSFEWAALVALLLQSAERGGKSMLAPHFSSMQILKTVLHFIATRDLIKKPLHLGTGTTLDSTAIEEGPILWDATRAHNVLYKVSQWSYRQLQTEAKLCLAMLGNSQLHGLEATFSRNLDVEVLRYDLVCRLNTSTLHDAYPDIDVTEMSQQLYLLLEQGLGNRVTQLYLSMERSRAWQIQQQSDARSGSVLQIALLLDPKNVDRAIDHGPAAEDKAAADSFRSFWGEKAELRRFKDGSILEALVWDTSPGRPPVLEQIIRYLLQYRFSKAASEQAEFVGYAYEEMLRQQKKNLLPVTSEAFKKFEVDLRGLRDIPLPIRQIVIASSTSTPVGSGDLTACDVVLQFESSGRWPDDLAAIQRTKLAFLLHISQLIQDVLETVPATVGLEHQDKDIFNQGFLDVLYPGQSLFRLRIYHDREHTLLDRILKDKNVDQKSAELAAQALAMYKREYLRKPAHAQAMQRLLSQQPILARTRALFDRWIAGHLLHSHVCHELIDLFVAHTFTRTSLWRTPTSVQTAFLRTIDWLAQWDWRIEPLVVELGTDSRMSVAEHRVARSRFEAWRKLDPGMNKIAMFVASSVDNDGTTYTTYGPSKAVASRLTSLARSAYAEIAAQDLQLQADSLFSSSLADFDFALHLEPALAGIYKSRREKPMTFKNLELEAASNVLAAAADPAADFLQELETMYGSAVLFMSGLPYRPIIAGLWTPQTADRPWKMNIAFSTMPQQAAEGMRAHLNASAILNEIARLGGDLVRRIEINHK